MLFEDVIGQHAIKKFLTQTVQHNRLSHAMLFLAPEGAGGLPMALAFAQYLVCTDKQQQGACGRCGPCKRAAGYIHPDIHFSYPILPRKPGDKVVATDYIAEWREFIRAYPYGNAFDWLQFIGAENRQGNIPAAECHDIVRKLNLKSYESEYKILVVWYPEFLGKEGNILLKLIEEPPPRTLFILVAEQPDQVLGTIVSRAQPVRFPPLDAPEIQQALISRGGVGESEAFGFSLLAEGSYREGLRLAQSSGGDDFLEVLREWLNAALRARPLELQQWIEEMAKTGRERQKQFLRYFLHLMEHTLRMQYGSGASLPFPDKERQFALSLQKMADAPKMALLMGALDDACFHIERNANAKILFHALSIRVRYILSGRPLPLESPGG